MGKAGPPKRYVPSAGPAVWVDTPEFDWAFWGTRFGATISDKCRKGVELQVTFFRIDKAGEQNESYSEILKRTLAVIKNPDIKDKEVIRQAALHTGGDVNEYYSMLKADRDEVTIQIAHLAKTRSREIRNIFLDDGLPLSLSHRYIDEDDDRYPDATPIEEFLNKYILEEDISAASTRKTIYNYID